MREKECVKRGIDIAACFVVVTCGHRRNENGFVEGWLVSELRRDGFLDIIFKLKGQRNFDFLEIYVLKGLKLRQSKTRKRDGRKGTTQSQTFSID